MNEELLGKGSVDRPEDFNGPRAWRHEEVAGAFAPAVWKEKKLEDFLTYPKRDQDLQSSCTCYNMAKLLAIDELQENKVYRELSPRSLYPYVAVPGGGAKSVEVAKLASKVGMTLEFLLPSDGLSEADMLKDKDYAGDAKQVALVYKPGSYIECGTSFDEIASILAGYQAQGIKKGVGVTIIGVNNGTWLSTFPKPPKKTDTALWYHRVTVTDFGLIDGKKTLSIDNSWGTKVGLGGKQFLGIEYQAAMYGGIYTLNQPDNWQSLEASKVNMPKYQWNFNLRFGSVGQDVMVLQTALQSLGIFPVSTVIKPTGNFYGLTQKSVELFQITFALPVTGIADEVTRAKLNEIFG